MNEYIIKEKNKKFGYSVYLFGAYPGGYIDLTYRSDIAMRFSSMNAAFEFLWKFNLDKTLYEIIEAPWYQSQPPEHNRRVTLLLL